ncbi:acyltransferase family protein [Dictyobacter halimunensis]|uniref:acyltransferase family protein n=1 Tax=Dictyobacter halimunensis TaxID=3026934 RepID=UPI0030C6E226
MIALSKDAPKKNTITVLDGVRGFACLLVIFYHVNMFSRVKNIWNLTGVNKVFADLSIVGSCGVTLFFVLSGFLLFLPYARSMMFQESWPSMRTFYIRRMCRIWPGYYVALIFLVIFSAPVYLQMDHWGQLALFLTFLMDSSHQTYQAINGPFWTLAVEWQYYMLLPFIALGIRWFVWQSEDKWKVATLFTCLLAMILWGLVTRAWGRSWEINPHQQLWAPSYVHAAIRFVVYGQSGKYLEDFAIGMIICACYLLTQRRPEQKMSVFINRYSWCIWLTGVIGFCFMTYWFETPFYAALVSYIGPHNWFYELGFAISFGLCILGVLFGPPVITWLWKSALLRNIGMLSYGLYIWHEPTLFWFMDNAFPYFNSWPAGARYALYWVCVFGLIVPFCYLIYRFIEAPAVRLGASLTRSQKAMRPVTDQTIREVVTMQP